MPDYRRYTIAELQRLTGTSRQALTMWAAKGWLIPTQTVGARRKFSIEAFYRAEQISNEMNEKQAVESRVEAQIQFATARRKRKNFKIPNPVLKEPGIGEYISPEYINMITGIN